MLKLGSKMSLYQPLKNAGALRFSGWTSAVDPATA